MNRYQIIILIGVVLLVAAYIFTDSGLYFKLVGDNYGRAYNKERIKQGQPIIEDYFVRKPQKRDKQLQVWRDTTGMHVHTEKSYYLSEYGRLAYETDAYKPEVDSVWLKKKLDITDLKKLDFWEFERLYVLNKGVEYYDISYRFKGDTYRTATLDMYEGDSLYRTIIGAPIEKRVPPSGPPFKVY